MDEVRKQELKEQGFELWIFTFGCGDDLAGRCQPIYAKSFMDARMKMFAMHGSKWSFQYSEQEWEKLKKDPKRYWPMETELKAVVADGAKLDVYDIYYTFNDTDGQYELHEEALGYTALMQRLNQLQDNPCHSNIQYIAREATPIQPLFDASPVATFGRMDNNEEADNEANTNM